MVMLDWWSRRRGIKAKALSKIMKIVSNNILREVETKTFYEKVIISLNFKGCENFKIPNSVYL